MLYPDASPPSPLRPATRAHSVPSSAKQVLNAAAIGSWTIFVVFPVESSHAIAPVAAPVVLVIVKGTAKPPLGETEMSLICTISPLFGQILLLTTVFPDESAAYTVACAKANPTKNPRSHLGIAVGTNDESIDTIREGTVKCCALAPRHSVKRTKQIFFMSV